MNALELADKLKKYSLVSGYVLYCHKAADEIRRQHSEMLALREAIVKLRESLESIERRSRWSDSYITDVAEKALKDTEEIAK